MLFLAITLDCHAALAMTKKAGFLAGHNGDPAGIELSSLRCDDLRHLALVLDSNLSCCIIPSIQTNDSINQHVIASAAWQSSDQLDSFGESHWVATLRSQ